MPQSVRKALKKDITVRLPYNGSRAENGRGATQAFMPTQHLPPQSGTGRHLM